MGLRGRRELRFYGTTLRVLLDVRVWPTCPCDHLVAGILSLAAKMEQVGDDDDPDSATGRLWTAVQQSLDQLGFAHGRRDQVLHSVECRLLMAMAADRTGPVP